jgi:hypothetical protein
MHGHVRVMMREGELTDVNDERDVEGDEETEEGEKRVSDRKIKKDLSERRQRKDSSRNWWEEAGEWGGKTRKKRKRYNISWAGYAHVRVYACEGSTGQFSKTAIARNPCGVLGMVMTRIITEATF